MIAFILFVLAALLAWAGASTVWRFKKLEHSVRRLERQLKEVRTDVDDHLIGRLGGGGR